ncbi:hypothetical protein CS078_23410 [Pseudomonas prosekii]|uniref:Uncharacterized protein n=1 Tax=Pseudomonas prosekii TaxID=1148509 RepID=A0A3L8D0D2_9PSED|nr:hypothetical protein [Pseudomonas prosekii]RLU05599.1 hypothetical protein CS078_23410 [Pseudomonas prosekii]RLU13659.1 hypothetical protein CS076_06145 [Pseudomonas prosekii]
MQTLTPSGLFPPTFPTEAQLHTGQLQDYRLMLAAMNEPPGVVHLSNLITIGPFSPLRRVSEDGLNALWNLLRDRRYIDMCHRRQIKQGDLSVTFENAAYVYRGWTEDGSKVTLPLTEQASWQALKPRIERAALLLGGQINSNQMISLERMCRFYGFAPWTPGHAQQHRGAIQHVQERIASHDLRLEDDFDILALRRRPTDKDRAAFRASRRKSAQPGKVDIQQVHAEIVRKEIIETVTAFIPPSHTSPLTWLASEVLGDATLEQVRATPTVYLQKILHSAEAQRLSALLLTTMSWYGAEPGEETSPIVRTQLVAQALQLWLSKTSAENSSTIAGYAWQAQTNWGKSYQTIRHEFEQHLITTHRAATEKEAVVIARLFLRQWPAEFRVRDIPEDLSYRSSIVWVNFVTGVNLIKFIDHRLLESLTFQQLVNLPIAMAESTTEDRTADIAQAKLQPTLDWAETYAVITAKPGEQFSHDNVETALAQLDKHTADIDKAVKQLNEAPVQRLNIAQREMEKIFGKVAFLSDGRKLARKIGRHIPRLLDVPYLKGKDYDVYSFLDVLASGLFDRHDTWFVTDGDGVTVGKQWIRIDQQRTIKTEAAWPASGKSFGGHPLVISPRAKMPDVKALFETEFAGYLQRTTGAYQTLITSLIASLPNSDRLALQLGDVRIFSLRKQTSGVEAQHETAEKILPLRARYGLILEADYASRITHYELLPKAGVIRCLGKLDPEWLTGGLTTERWSLRKSLNVSVDVRRHSDLPFDWPAHATGSAPMANARCQAIIEQLGDTLAAATDAEENPLRVAQTLTAQRIVDIGQAIASQLLFIDPKTLRDAAYGQTEPERRADWYKKALELAKSLVPFWGSLDDLASNDKTRWIQGAFGLFADSLSFALPIGKYASGSVRLITRAGQQALRAPLPSFKLLTMELLVSLAGNVNPLDGPVSLLTGLGNAVNRASRANRSRLMQLLGRTSQYDLVHSHPQMADISHWKPQTAGDQLARVKGIDDVPVRNLAASGKSDFRLIDPLSSKLYGPTLPTQSGDLSPGRSRYTALQKTDSHVVFDVPKTARVRELLEVDGRTTLLIDNAPYRLDDDHLHRADLIDHDGLMAQPCHLRRAPQSGVCETRYVTRGPAPTLAVGDYDETRAWAPWFGDILYTPATNRPPIEASHIARNATLQASLEFNQGMFGRVMVSLPVPGQPLVDNLRVGAIVVEASDGSRHYVFTRLNAGDFYVAERIKGQMAHELLTLKRAETLPAELIDELKQVYIGSLNANNIARIHGVDAVDRALKTMEEIAIPIGGHANPPDTLKLLSVQTSPGEAVLFDHSTRMIVSTLPEGATSWSRSKEAPEVFRQRTAEIFDTLFVRETVQVRADSNLKINAVMEDFQRILPYGLRRVRARNIAYAEVETASGAREVYVSVSGAQGLTGYLPVFRPPFHPDQMTINGTTYFNTDVGQTPVRTALNLTAEGKLLAVPLTIKNIETYHPQMSARPTSLDSEAKLISAIREKYPERAMIKSVSIATTMPPCGSCSVVIKEFGYDGGQNALQVLWRR